jgi:triosephosphate isomerase
MHSFVRNLIIKNYNVDLTDGVSVIYGGSIKSSNAGEIFSQKDVDGGLIGGSSLNFEEFVKIIESI